MSIFTNRELRDAMDRWEWEVEAEMVRLIRSGVPPIDAGNQARDIVTVRRREKPSDV